LEFLGLVIEDVVGLEKAGGVSIGRASEIELTLRQRCLRIKSMGQSAAMFDRQMYPARAEAVVIERPGMD